MRGNGPRAWRAAFEADERERLHLDDPDIAALLVGVNSFNAAAVREYSERVWGVDPASFTHTLPIVAGSGENIPAVLSRSDGATILYEGKLNSIFELPSSCKSWIGQMVVVEALRRGSRVIW